MFVLWCNGSTTVFGSVSGGSNPPGTTEAASEVISSAAFLFPCTIFLPQELEFSPFCNNGLRFSKRFFSNFAM